MDLVLNQNVTINDPKLKEVTTAIRKAGANVIGNTFKIAALIAKVENEELYAADGFADVFDYVKQCFGLEKSSAYNLIKVGNEFITEVEKGNIKTFETLLTHKNRDYSISQVFKMLPLGIDKAKELTKDGVIDVDMSCRQIEKIVKENTEGTAARGKKKNEPEPVDEPKINEPENDEPEDEATTLLIEWDELPDAVKNALDNEYDLTDITRIEIAGL